MDVGVFAGLDELVLGNDVIWNADKHIVTDGPLVKCGVLRDHSNPGSMEVYVEIGNWYAVHQDLALLDVVETFEKADHGGLATA